MKIINLDIGVFMKKVLFIAFYFNQTNEIASKRLRGLAKYLPQFGWEPIVIVPKLDNISSYDKYNYNFKVIETDYEYMLDKWLNKFKKTSKNNINDINNNNNNNENYNDNINNNINDNIDYNIDNNSTTNKNNNNNNDNNDKNKIANKLLSSITSIAGELFAYPDGMKYWYDGAIEASKEAIEVNDIQTIISSSWPVTSHIIAKNLTQQYNLKWIADLRDLWNMNPYVNHTFIRNHFEKKLEIETFKYANVLTTTTDLATKTLQKLHPDKKIHTVMSGYDLEDITENNTPKDIKKLNFTYAGSLYGGKRDPTLLFNGIRQLINEEKVDSNLLQLDFYGDSGELEKIAKKYKLEEVVNIHGKIAHSEVLKIQKESQGLLLLSWNDEKEEMFLPGKIYEYLAAKRPVLSIGYKEGSLKDIIEKTNIGHHVSTLEETKIGFMDFYNSYTKNNSLKYTGNSEVNNYSLLATARNFGNILDSIGN